MTAIKAGVGTVWAGAVTPVTAVPDAAKTAEYPSSGQEQPKEKRRTPKPERDADAVATNGDEGVLYTAKGKVVPAVPPPLKLDTLG